MAFWAAFSSCIHSIWPHHFRASRARIARPSPPCGLCHLADRTGTAPGAAQRPAQARARPDVRPVPLAPSAPVLARRGHACAVPVIPAEYATPLTMPLQGVMSGFYIQHTSDMGNAFSRVLRPYGAPCYAARVVPPRRLHQHPAEKPPGGPKGPARRRAGFRHRFRAGFDSVFARAREGIPISLCAPHSRLIVDGIVA